MIVKLKDFIKLYNVELVKRKQIKIENTFDYTTPNSNTFKITEKFDVIYPIQKNIHELILIVLENSYNLQGKGAKKYYFDIRFNFIERLEKIKIKEEFMKIGDENNYIKTNFYTVNKNDKFYLQYNLYTVKNIDKLEEINLDKGKITDEIFKYKNIKINAIYKNVYNDNIKKYLI